LPIPKYSLVRLQGKLLRWTLMVVTPKGDVHLLVGQRVVKLVLALLQTVSVGGGNDRANFVGQLQVMR
jgi:hypothetical protein